MPEKRFESILEDQIADDLAVVRNLKEEQVALRRQEDSR